MFAAEIALMTYNKYHAEQQANIVNNLPHVHFYNINIMQVGQRVSIYLEGKTFFFILIQLILNFNCGGAYFK